MKAVREYIYCSAEIVSLRANSPGLVIPPIFVSGRKARTRQASEQAKSREHDYPNFRKKERERGK